MEKGDKIGEWRIVRLLGTGGASEVYEVEHVSFGTRYALKLFKPSAEVMADAEKLALLQSRFISEGKLLARLQHPRIVRVHEYGGVEATGTPYFVMDLVTDSMGKAAQTLGDMQAEGIDPDQAAVWYEDLRAGLEYIHAHQIVHRDLKLENVMVGPDGHAVITDFGISRILDRDLRAELQMEMVTCLKGSADSMRLRMGSRGYFSPELERGEDATAASDLYALGVLMFRLLTGIWYEPDMDLAVLLDTYDPLWATIIPALLAERAAQRKAYSWRELDEKRRMDEAVAAENRLVSVQKRLRRARRVRAVAIVTSVVATLAAVAFAVARHNAESRLAIPTFDDVFFVPATAPLEDPDDEDAGMPSQGQLSAALPDAWMLFHGVMADLRAGRITREKAAERARVLAARAKRANDGNAELPFPDYYDQNGETLPLMFLFRQAAEKICPGNGQTQAGEGR